MPRGAPKIFVVEDSQEETVCLVKAKNGNDAISFVVGERFSSKVASPVEVAQYMQDGVQLYDAVETDNIGPAG